MADGASTVGVINAVVDLDKWGDIEPIKELVACALREICAVRDVPTEDEGLVPEKVDLDDFVAKATDIERDEEALGEFETKEVWEVDPDSEGEGDVVAEINAEKEVSRVKEATPEGLCPRDTLG